MTKNVLCHFDSKQLIASLLDLIVVIWKIEFLCNPSILFKKLVCGVSCCTSYYMFLIWRKLLDWSLSSGHLPISLKQTIYTFENPSMWDLNFQFHFRFDISYFKFFDFHQNLETHLYLYLIVCIKWVFPNFCRFQDEVRRIHPYTYKQAENFLKPPFWT